MVSQPDNVTTKTEPWDGARGPIKNVYKDVMKMYEKGNPKVWGEGKNQDYIADQSKNTVDAQKQITQIANQDPAYIRNSQKAINQVASGNAFGNAGTDVLKDAMNGVDMGTNTAAAGIGAIANGGQIGSQPGINTLSNLANYQNGATGQAANLNNFTNAGMAAQQAQANSLAGAQNSANQYLTATASGANIMGDPTLTARMNASDQDIFNNYMNIVKPLQNSQASLAGRTGSGAAQMIANQGQAQAMTAAANARNNMMADVYKTGVANQQAAASQLSNNYNSDVSNAMNANNNLAGTSNAQQLARMQGIDTYGNLNNAAAGIQANAANSLNSANQFDRTQQMNALGMQQDQYNTNIQNNLANSASMQNAANSFNSNQINEANARLQAASQAGDQRALDYYDASQLAAVGANQDARLTAELQARMAEFDAKQNKGMNNASNVLSLLQGGGYNNVTQPVQNNTMGQALGGITSLLGLFMSDERTKTHIKRIGTSPDGLGMYEYEYKADPNHKKYVGPMAQEVERKNPDAVVEIDGVKFLKSHAMLGKAA